MEFRILGPLEVVEQGRVLPLGGPRQRTLLALLLTRANEVVSADWLVDELWGAEPPRTAANALQYHVSQLRKALAPHEVIVTQEPGYMIRVGPGRARRAPLRARWWRRRNKRRPSWPRDGFAKLSPSGADRRSPSSRTSRSRKRRHSASKSSAWRRSSGGSRPTSRSVASQSWSVRSRHSSASIPLRERLRAALMQALYGSGRQVEALEVYRETRRLLVEELGIEPSPALHELEQAILRHDPALTSQGAPATPRQRAILIVATDPKRLEDLLAIAEPLARRPARELILARLLRDDA